MLQNITCRLLKYVCQLLPPRIAQKSKLNMLGKLSRLVDQWSILTGIEVHTGEETVNNKFDRKK